MGYNFSLFMLSEIFQKDSLGNGQSSPICWEKIIPIKTRNFPKITEFKLPSAFLKIGLSLRQHVLTVLELIQGRQVER